MYDKPHDKIPYNKTSVTEKTKYRKCLQQFSVQQNAETRHQKKCFVSGFLSQKKFCHGTGFVCSPLGLPGRVVDESNDEDDDCVSTSSVSVEVYWRDERPTYAREAVHGHQHHHPYRYRLPHSIITVQYFFHLLFISFKIAVPVIYRPGGD